MGHNYIRHCLLDVGTVIKALNSGSKVIVVPGAGMVGISSNRMLTYTKGTVCVHCKREIHYFAVEKHRHEKEGWHLNPYHKSKKGQEVLMTSDHIVAKANNGGNELANRQCMCQPCNTAKGQYDSVVDAEISKEVARAAIDSNLESTRRKLSKIESSIRIVKSLILKGDTSKNWEGILQRDIMKQKEYLGKIEELEKNYPTLDLAFEFDPMFIPRLLIPSLGSTLVLL